MKPQTPFARVEKLWPNSTIVCLASGPSLTQADVDYCRGRARVVCVNDTVQLAPWADVLFAADASWWNKNRGVPAFTGLKYSINRQTIAWPGVQVLRNTGPVGLERDPSGLKTGLNSGFQSLGICYHLGAKSIALLGFDFHGKHFDGKPAKLPSVYAAWIKAFGTIVEPLKAAGVSVVNCSPSSALPWFPKASLSSVLEVAA